MCAEHLKLLLQDVEAQELLAYAATRLARGLRKPDGGVRGIATGDVFRRLVARTLAKQWAPTVDQAARTYQHAMQSRAGMDALIVSVRAASDTRTDAVVVSLNGRNAYDSISRAAFLAKLREVAPQLLPFVNCCRSCICFFGQPSQYCWWDSEGLLREMPQGEGCEQGDPLAAARFALGQHDPLARAAASLDPQDDFLAFKPETRNPKPKTLNPKPSTLNPTTLNPLDDLYVVTVPSRARAALDGITNTVGVRHCIQTGQDPCHRGLAGIAELGAEVWRGDRPPHERDMIVRGSPVGHRDLVSARARRRCGSCCSTCPSFPTLSALGCFLPCAPFRGPTKTKKTMLSAPSRHTT